MKKKKKPINSLKPSREEEGMSALKKL